MPCPIRKSYKLLEKIFFKKTLHLYIKTWYNGSDCGGDAMKIIFINNRRYKDLNPIKLGYQECKPLYRCDPTEYPRPYTTIHYVFSGKGKLWKDGKEYMIEAGNMFIIGCGEKASYISDNEDPWVYCWVGFDGERCGDFSKFPTVMPHSSDIFREMLALENTDLIKESMLASLIFRLHAEIKLRDRQIDEYVSRVLSIINDNYNTNMTVEQIASTLKLNRHYISSVFKKETGRSIQEYLLFVRMTEAQKLLELGKSVTETAMLSGYTDSSTFSKIFKKHCGYSPSVWKENHDFYLSEDKKKKSIILDI